MQEKKIPHKTLKRMELYSLLKSFCSQVKENKLSLYSTLFKGSLNVNQNSHSGCIVKPVHFTILGIPNFIIRADLDSLNQNHYFETFISLKIFEIERFKSKLWIYKTKVELSHQFF